jgi:glycosyltransferase involved in cell wall biosynthesis
VLFLDFLPEEDIHALLNHSTLFLYLSKFEGFGLPVIEAMKCGIPVIASNLTSIPEIAGDAAILVSPDNDEQVLENISRVMNTPEMRNDLISKGLERSKYFSWKRTAEQVLACYENALHKGC